MNRADGPQVSIIIPVYNVEKYLARAVTSILAQTSADLELILVDDASQDGSAAIMAECAARDARVRCIVLPENQGVSAARNRGLDEARGEWIAFCDGDDWYAPDYLGKMLELAERTGADHVICDYFVATEGRAPVAAGSTGGLGESSDRALLMACASLSSCTHLAKRTIYETHALRYPLGQRQFEELPIMPMLARYAARSAVTQEALYYYYQRGDGSSASNTGADYVASFERALGLLAERLEGDADAALILSQHATVGLLYGHILYMLKQGRSGKEIRAQAAAYERRYPSYFRTPFYAGLGLPKRVFLFFERRRLILPLRLFAWAHGRFVS